MSIVLAHLVCKSSDKNDETHTKHKIYLIRCPPGVLYLLTLGHRHEMRVPVVQTVFGRHIVSLALHSCSHCWPPNHLSPFRFFFVVADGTQQRSVLKMIVTKKEIPTINLSLQLQGDTTDHKRTISAVQRIRFLCAEGEVLMPRSDCWVKCRLTEEC